MVRSFLFRDASQAGNIARVILMSAVRKIQPGYVHAQAHHFPQHGFAIAGWTDGADDLGAPSGCGGKLRGEFSSNKIQFTWFQILPECRRERPARASFNNL